MSFFKEIFAWWHGNTWGTRLTIWNQGRFVGEDDFGNRYYEQKKGVGPAGRPRRWVTYTDLAEASKVPLTGTAGCITQSMIRRLRKTTRRGRGRKIGRAHV